MAIGKSINDVHCIIHQGVRDGTKGPSSFPCRLFGESFRFLSMRFTELFFKICAINLKRVAFPPIYKSVYEFCYIPFSLSD